MGQVLEGKDSRLVSLDDRGDRISAQSDPDGFVAQYPQGVLAIDEFQRVPDLLPALKASVDRDRGPGRYVVTGSADLLSLRGAQESLAGRAQTIPLEGFSQDELAGTCADFASYLWSLGSTAVVRDIPSLSRRDYLTIVSTPSFPELRDRSERFRDRWLSAYTERLLSKDTADITGLQYPDRLQSLLSLLAARNGGEFVTSHVGRDVDIPERSLPTYLNALKSIYLVRTIPGWSNNVDGLEKAISSSLTGGLVEGFVAAELARQHAWSATASRMFHYRDDRGREVDLVLEDRRRTVVGIEVKASSTPQASDFRGLKHLRDQLGDRFVAGALLYTGSRSMPFGDRLWALPLGMLWKHPQLANQ